MSKSAHTRARDIRLRALRAHLAAMPDLTPVRSGWAGDLYQTDEALYPLVTPTGAARRRCGQEDLKTLADEGFMRVLMVNEGARPNPAYTINPADVEVMRLRSAHLPRAVEREGELNDLRAQVASLERAASTRIERDREDYKVGYDLERQSREISDARLGETQRTLTLCIEQRDTALLDAKSAKTAHRASVERIADLETRLSESVEKCEHLQTSHADEMKRRRVEVADLNASLAAYRSAEQWQADSGAETRAQVSLVSTALTSLLTACGSLDADDQASLMLSGTPEGADALDGFVGSIGSLLKANAAALPLQSQIGTLSETVRTLNREVDALKVERDADEVLKNQMGIECESLKRIRDKLLALVNRQGGELAEAKARLFVLDSE